MDVARIVAALERLDPGATAGAGPFALADKALLRQLARDGGLRPVQIFDVACPWIYPDDETALRDLGSCGIATKSADVYGPRAVNDTYRAAIAPCVQADGSYRIGATCRVLLSQPVCTPWLRRG